MKVKKYNYGIIHHVAFCQNCDFEIGIFTDETPDSETLLRQAKNHVKKTGHKVDVEKGSSCTYYNEEDKI